MAGSVGALAAHPLGSEAKSVGAAPKRQAPRAPCQEPWIHGARCEAGGPADKNTHVLTDGLGRSPRPNAACGLPRAVGHHDRDHGPHARWTTPTSEPYRKTPWWDASTGAAVRGAGQLLGQQAPQRQELARSQPMGAVYFTPTYSSWTNFVEVFFSTLNPRRASLPTSPRSLR